MNKTYRIRYDGDLMVTVRINHGPKTDEAIRDMVQFWAGWEARLREANGDYTTAFLRQLGRHVMYNRELPKDEEGWCNFGPVEEIQAMLEILPELDETLIEVE